MSVARGGGKAGWGRRWNAREKFEIAAETSAMARNGGKQDREESGGEERTEREGGRKGERYGWMGRQRRFQ